jgi:hypothetical protein
MDDPNRLQRDSNGDRTLGEAANRWVSFQIVAAVVGLILFLLFLFLFFLPTWRSMPVGL